MDIKKEALVIGLGQIGYSNAEYMTMKGLTVDGYDISEKAIRRAIDDQAIRKKANQMFLNLSKNLIETSSLIDAAKKVDVEYRLQHMDYLVPSEIQSLQCL
jgi:prephenate dehydrogenase